MKNMKNRKKFIRALIVAAMAAVMLSVTCFATEGTANVDTVITDLGTMVTGLLAQAEAVFGFITSANVLPWVLLGVGVSLISVGIWWVKWIMWGK